MFKFKKRATLFKNKRFTIIQDYGLNQLGLPQSFSYIDKPNAVGIVAIHNSNILMVEQYRHGAKRRLLEIPGGVINEGEKPYYAAIRELKEETGYDALDMKLLNITYPLPSVTNEKIFTFFSEKLEKTILNRDETELDMKLVKVPLNILPKILRNNKIVSASDALSIYSYLHVRHPLLLSKKL